MSNHIAIFLLSILNMLMALSTSAWRPLHGTTAQHMEMQMLHGLTALVASIGHHTEALIQLVFLGNLWNNLTENMACQLLVSSSQSTNTLHMLLRNYQSVKRCLWLQILEGQYQLILIYYCRRNLLGCNLAKNTICHLCTPPRFYQSNLNCTNYFTINPVFVQSLQANMINFS